VTAIAIHRGKQTAMHAPGELDVPLMLSEAAAFSLALALGHWHSPPLPYPPFLRRYDHSRIRHTRFWAQNTLTTAPTPPLQPPCPADEASEPPPSAAAPPASSSVYRSEPPLRSTDLRRSLDWPQSFYGLLSSPSTPGSFAEDQAQDPTRPPATS
jgi:hypothetical protein